MKRFFYSSLAALLLLGTACSGGNGKPETASMQLTDEFSSLPILTLTPLDTLQIFDDAYPVRLETAGDKMVVLFSMMEDTMIRVYDMESKTRLASIGLKGSGPEDVISPTFFYNRRVQGDSSMMLHDPNTMESLTISLTDYSIKKAPLNRALSVESSINYFDNAAMSYSIRPCDYFFKITQFEPESEIHVAYPFSLTEENATRLAGLPSTQFALNIFANEAKQRIMTAPFYFDAYYLYDFKGNLLKEFHLSTDDFEINNAINKQMNRDESERILNSYGYSTDEYCYIRRIISKLDFENKTEITLGKEIIKVDWDGNPVAIIKLPESNVSFCVDSNDDIIAINNISDEDEAETYSIIKYRVAK